MAKTNTYRVHSTKNLVVYSYDINKLVLLLDIGCGINRDRCISISNCRFGCQSGDMLSCITCWQQFNHHLRTYRRRPLSQLLRSAQLMELSLAAVTEQRAYVTVFNDKYVRHSRLGLGYFVHFHSPDGQVHEIDVSKLNTYRLGNNSD